ncbi:MAG: AhpC/TSA family protein [Opitutae bacterium]|nr:AhpC/TSA family protein [Opitutae bacterium]
MITRTLSAALVSLALSLAARAELAPSPTDARPLAVGAHVPFATLKTADGADLDLSVALAAKPTLVIFYRGSWCPYCNKHLAALVDIEPKLLALGYQILAISPDEPANLRVMSEKNHLNYQLLSDRGMAASEAFGVAFRVDSATVTKYREYKIDLPPVPGEPTARWLPVPAAFLIGRDGVIRYVYSNADYKVRASADALLAAAQQNPAN